MILRNISLNTLRAFEAAARHLNFTRAAEELCVTPAAVSHQVKALENHLGTALFSRTARGLVLTDEGLQLAPVISGAFGQVGRALEVLGSGASRDVVAVGAVGTFATGFLLRRLAEFEVSHPTINVRVQTNNNKADLWTEALDFAIRFGDGAWHGTEARCLMEAPVTPLCAPTAATTLTRPTDLARHNLLRSYRTGDWASWLKAAAVPNVVARGPQFDSSVTMVQAAIAGDGIALAPPRMFERELALGHLVQPFGIEVDIGSYWLTHLPSKKVRPAMQMFTDWLCETCVAAVKTEPNKAG